MGRKHSEETRQKISHRIKELHQHGRLHGGVFHPSVYQQMRENATARLLSTPFEMLSLERKRDRVSHEQQRRCAKCNNDTWLGQPIVLELDHKNGIGDDNRRVNLEMLCPNCHSLTPTWRGRNKPAVNSRASHVPDEELLAALERTSSIRQALLAVGMAAKGANYVRAKRLKETLSGGIV